MPWQLVRLRLVWIDAETVMENHRNCARLFKPAYLEKSAGRYEHNLPNETEKNLSLPLEISFAVMLMRPDELFRTLCANLMRHEQTLHLD